MSTVVMFPGQGSQFVGMGKEVYDGFAAARDVFCEVDEVLGRAFSQVIFEGPDEVLTSPCNAQLAILTVSIAVLRAVESVLGRSIYDIAQYMAGHSVGEYVALCAAGAISLADVVELVKVRGDAMTEASSKCGGGMAALIGGDISVVERVVKAAKEYGVCDIANDNCTGQIVVSGVEDALSALPKLVEGTSIKRVIRLRVAGPFHSSLMNPAYEKVEDFIRTVDLHPPKVKMVFNVSASEHDDCDVIKGLVTRQIVSRVRWRESVQYLLQKGCSLFLEIGPGEVLAGLLRRIDSSARAVSICSSESLRELSGFVEAREYC